MATPPKCVSFSEETPEFFKLFIPKLSAKQMWIPPAFARKFIPRTLQNAILKDSSGKSWNIALVTREQKLYFETGWEEFARAQFLEFGDFLLFKYNGNSLFEVKIFGKNGCKKEEVLGSPETLGVVKIEEEQTQRGLNGSTQKITGSSEECRDKTTEKTAKKLAQRRTSRPAKYGAPKSTHFVATVTDSMTGQHGVYIPVAMVKEIELNRDMSLLCRNGKSWPVRIAFWKDGRSFIKGGWPEFRMENNLQVDDKCVFELVLGKGNTCKEMKVGFIRGGARSTTHDKALIKYSTDRVRKA